MSNSLVALCALSRSVRSGGGEETGLYTIEESVAAPAAYQGQEARGMTLMVHGKGKDAPGAADDGDAAQPATLAAHEIAVHLSVEQPMTSEQRLAAKQALAAMAAQPDCASPAAAAAAAALQKQQAPATPTAPEESQQQEQEGAQALAFYFMPAPTRPRSSLPSYARPTAAHAARVAPPKPEEEDEEPYVCPPKPHPRPSPSSSASKVLAPTAAFLARIAGRGPGARSAAAHGSGVDALRKSMASQVLSSPQGQRVTQAQPFSPHVTAPKQAVTHLVSSEQAVMAEAERHKFRPRPAPKHLHEQRPIEGVHVTSQPKNPQELFQPFQLASVGRHEAERARAAAEAEERRRKEEAQRVFKATSLDMAEIAPSPPKPAAKAPTVPQPPQLSVDARSVHHKTQVAPAKWAKMSAAERKEREDRERETRAEKAFHEAELQRAREAREKSRALERMPVEDLRRSMTFKAMPLPEPAKVFSPDRTKGAKVTQSIDFTFRTEERAKAHGGAK